MAEESNTEDPQNPTASAASAPSVGTQTQTQMLHEASNLETLLRPQRNSFQLHLFQW